MQHEFKLQTGETVRYWAHNDTKKPTILMIHGFRGTHHGLQRIVDHLPDYRIIVPDLPGFGASDALKTEHTLDAYVQFVHEFRAFIEQDSAFYVLGHSFGSIVVSHYAAAYPHEIKKLVLVNPIGAPALEGSRRTMTKLAVTYYWIGRKLPERLARTWLGLKPITKIMSITMRKTTNRELRRYIDQQHYAHFSTFASPKQLAEAFNTSVSHDVKQVADSIAAPTLIIAGDKDDITDIGNVRVLHQKIAGAELVVIENVGHLTHYETPDQVAAAIKTFIG